MIPINNVLIRASIITSVGLVISTILNFATYTLLLRNLSIAEYGLYAGLFSLTALSTVLSPSLNLYFTKLGAYAKNHPLKDVVKRKLIAYSLRVAAGAAILFFFILLFHASMPVFPQFQPYMWFVFFLTVLGLLHPMTDGILRGLQRFTQLSLISTLGTLTKAMLVTGVIWFIPGLGPVLVSILLSIGVMYGLSILFVYRSLIQSEKQRRSVVPEIHLPNIMKLTFITLSLTSFTNIDILLVRTFLSPDSAALYAVEMNIAKIVLYGNAILTPILYTLSSEKMILKEKSTGVMMQSIGFSVIFSMCVIVFFIFFSPLFFKIFNKTILPADNFVWIMAIAISFYSASDIFIHYLLSQNILTMAVPLFLLGLLQIVLLIAFHSSLMQVVLVIVIVHCLIFLVSLGFFVWYNKPPFHFIQKYI